MADKQGGIAVPKVALDAKAIEAAIEQAFATNKTIWLWDQKRDNFGLRISPNGTASWIVQLWQGGRGGNNKRLVIGRYAQMKIREAHIEADKIIGDLRNGVDVAAQRKGFIQDARQRIESGNLESAIEQYLKRKAQPGKYWEENKRIFYRDVLPALGSRTSLSAITKTELRALIEKKEEKAPGVARYLFSVLRPFFAWCVERELIKVSPMDTLKAPPLRPARDRILSDDEIAAFWHSCEEIGWPFGPLFKLLLLTGQRREELAAIRWDELTLDKAEWVIPGERTKNGKEHIVHLSEQALAIIGTIPKQASEFVFTTTLKTSVSGYSKAKRELDKLMASAMNKPLKPWRLHDLRRTAASGMARLNFPPHIVERVINHLSGAQGGLVRVYQRHEYIEERRAAIYAWNNYVASLCDKEAAQNNIIELRRA